MGYAREGLRATMPHRRFFLFALLLAIVGFFSGHVQSIPLFPGQKLDVPSLATIESNSLVLTDRSQFNGSDTHELARRAGFDNSLGGDPFTPGWERRVNTGKSALV
ncbi:hypothetical protein F4780DRAFT_200599 [Xylariomycetidae sp. FL0641]|nr:hypothetical protein F4780DRAFT_200599 [Xylariomycetidae sp. FL0641]